MQNKLVLTSYGLTSEMGRRIIGKELEKYNLTDKKIFLFHEPHYSIELLLVEACYNLGFRKENIILSGQQESNNDIMECDFFYCTEGNTFEVFSLMRERGIDRIIKAAFQKKNKIYIGASAGATIAGISIEVAKDFDRNFVNMVDFQGLGLFNGIIIPHYTKKELKCYIKNTPEIEMKYKLILSVSNDKSVVLEV